MDDLQEVVLRTFLELKDAYTYICTCVCICAIIVVGGRVIYL